MDPMSALMIGSTVLTVGSSIYSGVQGIKAANAERGQLELEKKSAEIAALDQENERRSALERSLAAQEAAAAAMGIVNRPGTSLSRIQAYDREQNAREIRQIRLNAYMQGRGYKAASRAAKSAGVASLIGGIANAGGSLFDYGLKKYNLQTPEG